MSPTLPGALLALATLLVQEAPPLPEVDGAPRAEAAAEPDPQPPPAAFSGSTSLRMERHGDNRNERPDDDHFADAILRSNLALDGGDARFAVRFDGEAFARPPAGPDRRDDLRIERVTLDLRRAWAPGGMDLRTQLTLGDLYVQLGRGLALSLRRIDELGIDLALRGARGEASLGDGQVTVTVLGGVTNVVNIDPQYLVHVDDPGDPLGAARVEGRVGELALGAHLVGLRDGDPAEGLERRSVRYGGTADLSLAAASLGLEVDGHQRDIGGTTERGWAAYLVATVPIGQRLTLLGEGKHYARFPALTGAAISTGEGRFIYNQPPTAERIDQELVDNTDVTGGRLRADVLLDLESSTSVHGSLGLFKNRAISQWIAHGFAGLDLRWPSSLAALVSGGYRREWLVESGALSRAIAHGELDLVLPLAPRVSLHAIARHESHAEATGPARYVFHRGGASLEAALADRLVLGGGVDWDTQNQTPDLRRRFGFGLVRWRHSDALILQLLAGSQRGGIRCIAGACRIQPPFAGVRLDLNLLH